MIYTNRRKYIEKIPRPSICRKHFRNCKVCGKVSDERQLEQGICQNCRKHFQKCRLCGKMLNKKQLQSGICQDCLNKGEHYRCARCGREMIYTNRQKYIEKVERPKICQECFKRRISKKDILSLFRNRGY